MFDCRTKSNPIVRFGSSSFVGFHQPGLVRKQILNSLITDGIIVSHLPDGPTAHFKLSSVKLGKDVKVLCTIFVAERAHRVNRNIIEIYTCRIKPRETST